MSQPRLNLREFSEIVQRVTAGLPSPLSGYLENVVVDVEERPSKRTLRQLGWGAGVAEDLMGLFQGSPLPEQQYGERHPNRITLYKLPIERACRSRAEIAYEVRRTIIHELAHHFGFSEEDLDEFEGIPSPFDKEEEWEES